MSNVSEKTVTPSTRTLKKSGALPPMAVFPSHESISASKKSRSTRVCAGKFVSVSTVDGAGPAPPPLSAVFRRNVPENRLSGSPRPS